MDQGVAREQERVMWRERVTREDELGATRRKRMSRVTSQRVSTAPLVETREDELGAASSHTSLSTVTE